MSYLSNAEIKSIGFKHTGKNVLISDKSTFYNAGQISIGDNVRIDDFCVFSAGEGGINIGNNIHIAVFCSLIGAGNINISDFSNISSRVSIYSSNDDYSGQYMTNPTIPPRYTNVTSADVHIGTHVIIGSGCIILPGINISDGVAVAALSLIKHNCESFFLYAGVPARKVKERSRKLLEIEEQYSGNLQK